MLTTTELAKKTGLSVKTLGRWSDQGILPKPRVDTSPSGRGKVGYWPDDTLPFLRRILDLRRKGHSLNDAVNTACLERYESRRDKLDKEAQDPVYGDKFIKTPAGEDVDLVAMLHVAVTSRLRDSILDAIARNVLWVKLPSYLSAAIHQIQAGYNVFLAFDGKQIAIRPDFVFHEAGSDMADPTAPFFVIPLNPLYDEILQRIGLVELIQPPKTSPAPKVWTTEKNGEVREYQYFQKGKFGYQFVGSDKGALVGMTPPGQPATRPRKPRKPKSKEK